MRELIPCAGALLCAIGGLIGGAALDAKFHQTQGFVISSLLVGIGFSMVFGSLGLKNK